MSTREIFVRAPPDGRCVRSTLESIALALINEDHQSDVVKHVRTKIGSYRKQDQRAGRPEYGIAPFDVLRALLKARMLCTYCLGRMSFFPREKGDVFQWTLDRVDNDDGHSLANCEVSCLQCNLRKKRRNSEGFKFGMQVKVTKEN